MDKLRAIKDPKGSAFTSVVALLQGLVDMSELVLQRLTVLNINNILLRSVISQIIITCTENILISLQEISQGTINNIINGTPKGVYLPISKLHSVLVVANLLAHNNLWE